MSDARAIDISELGDFPAGDETPLGPLEARLAEMWCAALDIERIGRNEDFFELGGDSLAGAAIFAAIERDFGLQVPLSVLVEAPTLRQLAVRLASATAQGATAKGTDSLLVPLRLGGARPPLFCLHDLSGTVVAYRRLAAHLSDERPVYGLQYPGQDRTEPPRLGLEALAARYCAAIRGQQPGGPYHLAGFSLGGTLAYEVARQLSAAGQEVALLALLDSTAPGSDPKGLRRLARHLGEFAQRPPATWPAYALGRWRNRRARQRADRALYASDETGDGIGARLERLAGEILPQAARAYRPDGYDGRAVLFRCAEDIALWRHSPDKGWDGLVAGGLELRDIEATHQFLMQEPAVAELAAQLEDFLAQPAAATAQDAAAAIAAR